MKVGKNCPYCMNEAFTLSGMQSIVFTIEQQQLVDSGVHPVKCPKGHEFAVIFKGAKFEVLFDLALNAIKDGYSREAVSSFASSLERFYEFFIRFCGYSNGLNMEAFDKVWKNVSNQSERQ
ncbi:hypothetical protein L1D50_23010, partial [Pseudoalteromonas sp. Isolate6]|uniref:hypothetical protein n=1 Tax=Pseudoalteromonas sp. Isolate6 TaxID=2908527 RepID=UPI001EFEA368